MRSTVRPEQLEEAVKAEVDAAMQSLHALQQAEQQECNQFTEPQQYLADFLRAARGVFSIVKTFGENNLQPAPFNRWVEAWQHTLKPEQQQLWRAIGTESVAEEPAEEGRLMSTWIPITHGRLPEDYTDYAELGIPRPSGPTKRAVRFRAYPDRPASEVCAEYLTLMQQLVADFLRQHAQLVP